MLLFYTAVMKINERDVRAQLSLQICQKPITDIINCWMDKGSSNSKFHLFLNMQ